MIVGSPVRATTAVRSTFVISPLGIFTTSTPTLTRPATLFGSNGVEKATMPSRRPSAMNAARSGIGSSSSRSISTWSRVSDRFWYSASGAVATATSSAANDWNFTALAPAAAAARTSSRPRSRLPL